MAVLNKFAKPTVLVTGATGIIGRAVCRDLVVNGYLVMGLVRNVEAKERLPYAVIPTVGDVRNPGSWEHAVEQADILIHLALESLPSAPRERADAERQARAMAGVLDGVATLCRRHKKLMIHTFGALLYEPDPDGWARETSEISHGKGYGIRHTIGYPVLQKQRKRGLRAMSVNPGFVYGSGGSFESDMLEPMSRGESVIVPGEGAQVIHYIEASDAASGYRLAIERGIPGEDYLLADDQPSTLGEFAALVAREMGAPPPTFVPEEELVQKLGAWAVEAWTTCPRVDSTKARRDLGWAPRYRTIQEGVPAVVRAYQRGMARSSLVS